MNSFFKNWRSIVLVILTTGALSQSAEAYQGDIGVELVVGQKITLGAVLQESGLVIDSFAGNDWQSKLSSILGRLGTINPSRSGRYQKRLEVLLQGTRFLPSVTLQYEGPQELALNPGSGEVQKTLAVLHRDPLPLQPELIVDQDLWNRLDETQKAMAFFEVLVDLEWREIANKERDYDYSTVWKFVDAIVSVNSKTLPQKDWRQFLYDRRFPDADWEQCRIDLREYVIQDFYGHGSNSPSYGLQFLDDSCSVSIQGRQVKISKARVDGSGKWQQVTLFQGALLSLRNGSQVTFSNIVTFDSEEFPSAGTLAFPQVLQTGGHQSYRCGNWVSFHPSTGNLETCRAELPVRVVTPTQDLTLFHAQYEDKRLRTLKFFENGEWSPYWSWLGDADASGKLLLKISTGRKWVQGTVFIRSRTPEGHARFKLDQDIQYSLHGVSFSAKAGDTVPVFIDGLGADLSGGSFSQDTTIQTPLDRYELGGGRCFLGFGKKYDSLVDFYRDGSLATGVLLGDVLLKHDASDWHDGSRVWTESVRGPVRVNLDPKGFQMDFEEYVCGNSKEPGDEQ